MLPLPLCGAAVERDDHPHGGVYMSGVVLGHRGTPVAVHLCTHVRSDDYLTTSSAKREVSLVVLEVKVEACEG
jgi:hypothetical protein